MPIQVHVEANSVNAGIQVCKTAIHSLKDASAELQRSVQNASGDWSDAKFQQVREIVDKCTRSLSAPITDLESCQKSLTKLLDTVKAYDQQQI